MEKKRVFSNLKWVFICKTVQSVLQLITDQVYYAWETNCDLPKGNYAFDTDGKLLNGFVEKADGRYYYVNGKPTEKYLFYCNGDYYYSRNNGMLVVDGSYYAYRVDSTSELPKGMYEFDADGKMIGSSVTGEIVNKNGVLYYYEGGMAIEKGLFCQDGHYYYARYDGSLIVNQNYYVWKDNDLLFPKTYTFNELG